MIRAAKIGLRIFLLFLSTLASASNKGVYEGVPTTNFGIFIDTKNARSDFNSTSYTGGTSNIGVNFSSNVSIGNDACVLYSSGSISCGGTNLNSSLNVSGNAIIKGPIPWIDLKAYGAKCDFATNPSPTDDTTAIQNAFNVASANGGTIYISSGICYLNQTRINYVSTSPVTIMGNGWGTGFRWNPAIDSPAQPSLGMFNIGGPTNQFQSTATYLSQISIHDISFDFGGSSLTAYNTHQRGFNIFNFKSLQVYNVLLSSCNAEMLGMGNTGDGFNPGTNVWIHNNLFYNYTQDAINPNAFTTIIDHNEFLDGAGVEANGQWLDFDNNIMQQSGGVVLSNALYARINNNTFIDCPFKPQLNLNGCIDLSGQGGTAGNHDVTISNNIITELIAGTTNAVGIYEVPGTNTMQDSTITMVGNVITNLPYGIYLNWGNNILVADNYISSSSVTGITWIDAITAPVSSVTFINNVFNQNPGIDWSPTTMSVSTRNVVWLNNTTSKCPGCSTIGSGRTKANSDIYIDSPNGSLYVNNNAGASGAIGIDGASNGSPAINYYQSGALKAQTIFDNPTQTYILNTATMAIPAGGFSVGASTLSISGGKIGVGTTSPSASIHINEPALNNPTPFLVGASSFIVSSNGNIGIGTSNPTTLFYMNSSGNAEITSISGGTGNSGSIYQDANSNQNYVGQENAFLSTGKANLALLATTGLGISLWTNGGNERMFISSGGNVGIGTTGPVFKLDTNSYEVITNACTGVTSCTATCSAGKNVVGGGCTGVTSVLSDSAPGSGSWICTITLGNVTAKAICMNIN